MKDSWQQFWFSGSVADYLNYKNKVNDEKAKSDDNADKGFSNKRTDNRGE